MMLTQKKLRPPSILQKISARLPRPARPLAGTTSAEFQDPPPWLNHVR